MDSTSSPLLAATEQFFEAYSAHDVERMVSLCSPDLTFNYVPEGERGRGGRHLAKDTWFMFTALIPDFHVQVGRILVGDGFVVAETLQGGTPAADIGPIVAKGDATKSPHCYVLVFSDDALIREITCYWDYNQIFAQLRHTERHD